MAAKDCVPADQFAKCVVYLSPTGFGMAVIPADRTVDMRKLAALVGWQQVRLAHESEIAFLFPDCEVGTMPPFGPIYHMPVIVDYGVAANEYIAFAVGTHRDVVRMRFDDYRRLSRPVITALADSAAS